jgi:hypothetical protein
MEDQIFSNFRNRSLFHTEIILRLAGGSERVRLRREREREGRGEDGRRGEKRRGEERRGEERRGEERRGEERRGEERRGEERRGERRGGKKTHPRQSRRSRPFRSPRNKFRQMWQQALKKTQKHISRNLKTLNKFNIFRIIPGTEIDTAGADDIPTEVPANPKFPTWIPIV